jgi:heme A synthase
MRSRKFAIFAWVLIGVNLLVIVWGAYVRASGSGAGCGSHWPLCNGQVVPTASAAKTAIEFTHRFMSGLDFLMVVALVVLAFRLYPKRTPVRRTAAWSFVFIVTEALIGAGLVKLDLVAHNASGLRALFISIHLVNTFMLLGSLCLTAWLASGGEAPDLRRGGAPRWLLLIGLTGLAMVGALGAITALGDTLFPAKSLAEGFQQDWSAGAHLFVRLRIIHPILAGIVGCYLVVLGVAVSYLRPRPATQRLSMLIVCLVATQFFVGLLNFGLLAPVGLQMTHLIVADVLWLTLVLFAAAALSTEPKPVTPKPIAASAQAAA